VVRTLAGWSAGRAEIHLLPEAAVVSMEGQPDY